MRGEDATWILGVADDGLRARFGVGFRQTQRAFSYSANSARRTSRPRAASVLWPQGGSGEAPCPPRVTLARVAGQEPGGPGHGQRAHFQLKHFAGALRRPCRCVLPRRAALADRRGRTRRGGWIARRIGRSVAARILDPLPAAGTHTRSQSLLYSGLNQPLT